MDLFLFQAVNHVHADPLADLDDDLAGLLAHHVAGNPLAVKYRKLLVAFQLYDLRIVEELDHLFVRFVSEGLDEERDREFLLAVDPGNDVSLGVHLELKP